jgi:hypothetical protein
MQQIIKDKKLIEAKVFNLILRYIDYFQSINNPNYIIEDILVLSISLTPSLFIEACVPSQKSERSCICELGISIFPLCTIFLLVFGTVISVVYFFPQFNTYNITSDLRRVIANITGSAMLV